MGWDAHSSAKVNWKENRLRNANLNRLFINAHGYVKRKTGGVDGFLSIGSLDVDDCALMLEKATGKSCWDEKGWSKKEVKEIYKKADWDFEYKINEAWAYWSAKKFLEVCAKSNLSIRFSY